MPDEAKNVTLVDVQRFFDIPMNKFRAEWGKLTDRDKTELKHALGAGNGTY
jgi:hypothetical protein